MSSARPVRLGDDGHASFGWWHGPDDGQCRAGVVLCPPLGFDYLQSHYALRALADELSRAGLCAVRLDYHGTGDSSGSDDEPDRVAAWLGTIGSAAALLRAHGAPSVCLVGMRSGATLCARVAANDDAVDQVVLWDPCASGKTFLAEQRALLGMALGAAASRADGAVEIPGTLYDATTVGDLERLSIVTCPRPLARRVLVLTRPDRPCHPGLTDGSLASAELCRAEATGQRELMDLTPPLQALPMMAIRRIATWLSEGTRAPAMTMSAPATTGAWVVGLDEHHRPILETPVTVPPVGLFGVMTLVEEADPAARVPTVLMLNNGTHHHVGPSRAWVDLARRWAAAGIRSIRLDMSGMGDSPHRDPADTSWACHKPDAFDDVADTMRWASPDDPTNVVLVGLCSSGYQALEAALADRARGAVAINPSIAFLPAERSGGRSLDERRRIALPKDAIADTFREGGQLGWLRDAVPDLAWRVRALLSPGQRSGRWLTALARQGTDTLLVCGDDELRPVRSGVTGLQLHRLMRTGLMRLEHVEGLQHSLLLADQRRVVLDLVAEHVIGRFAPRVGQPAEERQVVTTP